MAKKIFIFLLDILFPRKCLGCKKEGDFLCSDCFSNITIKESQVCPVCKRTSSLGKTHYECKNRTPLNGLLVACSYHGNPLLEKAIKQFKYYGSKDISQQLGALLVEILNKNTCDQPLLIPVPLHKKRNNWRGFNQAELLAEEIQKKKNYSIVHLLQRVKHTKQQAKMKRKERLKNMKDAFSFVRNEKDDFSLDTLKSKNIFLVDDVSSTLVTLEECAKVLKKEGCKNVYGIVLARG